MNAYGLATLTTLTTLVSFCFAAPSRAQDPFASADPFAAADPFAPAESGPAPVPNAHGINLRYEVFSLDLPSAAAMMRARKPDGELYQLLIGLTESNKAKLESLTILRTLPGERATSEAIAEIIYPTEWDPAELPNSLGILITPPPAKDGTPSSAPLDVAKLAQAVRAEDMTAFVTPVTATAFETRNLGISLEVEATLGNDNKTVGLSIAPEHVTHVGATKWGTGVSQTEMPEIETQRLATTVQVQVGAPRLLGTVNRPAGSKVGADAAGRIWFAFVTASLVR